MIIREKVKVKWNGLTRKHYEELGYKYTKKDEEFEVYSDELSKGSNIKVKFVCDYCGRLGERQFGNLVNARKEVAKDCCPKCASLKHNEVLIKRNKSLAEKYPELMDEWCFESNDIQPTEVTSHSGKSAWWMCRNGHKWRTAIYARTSQRTGCPICSETKGEKAVTEILIRKGITFSREVSFSDLQGEGSMPLRFDFAIKDGAGFIKLLIEYDGPFHFGEVYVGDTHDKTMRYDKLKDKFCEEAGIPLYRIPYYKYDLLEEEIEKILGNYILSPGKVTTERR